MHELAPVVDREPRKTRQIAFGERQELEQIERALEVVTDAVADEEQFFIETRHDFRFLDGGKVRATRDTGFGKGVHDIGEMTVEYQQFSVAVPVAVSRR
ncbi:conserved hypothetical protein [Ricinus communis]|uniref:Uncharacterized protein n=1 Tax=Ricinus communis TaxID=3988 RepID=B9TKU2_RICCO|nr:conserved hypothetical protein [Ricinus communis]